MTTFMVVLRIFGLAHNEEAMDYSSAITVCKLVQKEKNINCYFQCWSKSTNLESHKSTIRLVVNKHFPCSSLFSLVYSFLINRFWDFRTTCYLWTPYQKASWPTVACPPCYWKETCLKWRFIRLNRYVHLTITLFDHTQALQQLDGHELYLERFAETRKKLDWWFDKTCNFLKNT